MTMERIHGAMYEVVMRQGLQARTVAAVSLHGMKKRPAAMESAGPQVLSQTGGETALEGRDRGMAMSKWRVVRTCPLLMIMDCR